MKVVIIGSGVIGVSTAWYLAKQGCDVTVIEKNSDSSLETSFANAGQISPGYATPWAAPGIPQKAIKWLFQKDAPLKIKPDGSIFQIQWIIEMMKHCTYNNYAINKERMLKLAEYSRDKFVELRQEIGIQYDDAQLGNMQLFRSQKQLDGMQKDITVLNECGVPYKALDPNGCVEFEPALANSKHLITGGLLLPNDETGDCLIFTQKLTKECEKLGVKFLFNKKITKIKKQHHKITAVICGREEFIADHYVMAAGCFSRDLMKQLDISIPVYPVKGYSLTLDIIDDAKAPRSTLLDETYKVAVTRLGNRVRVGGMAELIGYDLSLNDKRRLTLEKVVTDLFPNSVDLSKPNFWTGLRPMTPDSTPIVGTTPIHNLTLNTGHGTLGWTMCLGSGKYLADVITGKTPEIQIDGLDISRYNKV
ncbi:MAG: D-amino acid dehydrogenase [Burkholderiales bacterium]|nr:D-amino acid dehydrogenase [Burkholderiales bacterium]